MSCAGTQVAAFDVDGTLTTGDCVGPFLRRVGGLRAMAAGPLRQPRRTARGVLERDRDALKEVVVGGVLGGRVAEAVDALGEAFAAEVFATRLRPDTVARLRWHQRSGHVVVLVSASLGAYLRPLGRLLAVDAALCTDPSNAGGRYAASLDGGNNRGPQKAARLRRWLDESGLGEAQLWVYGDSAGDREMLAMAEHPVVVRNKVIDAAPR